MLLAALLGALLASGLGLFLHRFKLGSGLTQWSYDLSLVARGDVLAPEAVLVYMDEVSHEKLGQPLNAPWDRRLHAQLIERLGNAGAKAIVFDIVFSDPDREPAADTALANAIKTNQCVILGADNVPTGPKSSRFLKPIDVFLDSSAGLGSVEVIPDADLIVRKHTPEPQIPTLSMAALECSGAPGEELAGRIPGERWLNYYGPPNSLNWKSYYEALDPVVVKDEFFRGKTVFIGARLLTKYAGDRKDEYRNPYSFLLSQSAAAEQRRLFISGAEIQATMFLNLLRQDWLTRAPFGREQLFILVAGLVFGFGLTRFNPVAAAGLAVMGLVAVGGGAYLLFTQKLIWFPWLIMAVQISAALLWSVMFNSIQLYVQKRVYEHTLAIYLSPKLVKKFSGDTSLLQPGAEERRITMFFSDIADFTSLSRDVDSDTLAKFMNQYFHTAVSRCIHPTDGTVVKYIGDGIFAFWNAPDEQPNHALQACEAALLFREQAYQQRLNGEPLRTRIGLHTDVARVGNFGSPERVDYTALGESVNLTSRLEGLNKHLGTECLLSEDTNKAIGDRLITRALGAFQMKGFDEPVEVFELLGRADQLEPTRQWRETFAQALNNYRERNLEFAAAGFRRVLDLNPGDGPSKFYLRRLEELHQQALPDNWSTNTILREK